MASTSKAKCKPKNSVIEIFVLGELYSKPAAASHVLLKCCKCPVRRVPRPLASLQHTKRNRLRTFHIKKFRGERGGSMVVFYFPASRMRCNAYSISRRKTPTDAWIMMLQLGGSWPKKSQKENGGEGCNFPEIFDNRAPLLLCMPCPGFFSIL